MMHAAMSRYDMDRFGIIFRVGADRYLILCPGICWRSRRNRRVGWSWIRDKGFGFLLWRGRDNGKFLD